MKIRLRQIDPAPSAIAGRLCHIAAKVGVKEELFAAFGLEILPEEGGNLAKGNGIFNLPGIGENRGFKAELWFEGGGNKAAIMAGVAKADDHLSQGIAFEINIGLILAKGRQEEFQAIIFPNGAIIFLCPDEAGIFLGKKADLQRLFIIAKIKAAFRRAAVIQP